MIILNCVVSQKGPHRSAHFITWNYIVGLCLCFVKWNRLYYEPYLCFWPPMLVCRRFLSVLCFFIPHTLKHTHTHGPPFEMSLRWSMRWWWKCHLVLIHSSSLIQPHEFLFLVFNHFCSFAKRPFDYNTSEGWLLSSEETHWACRHPALWLDPLISGQDLGMLVFTWTSMIRW